MTDLPIFCTLGPDALRARREALLSELVHEVVDQESLPDGLRFRFEAGDDTLARLARAVDAERRCCRFVQFAITVAPDSGPITLELTGPPGTREFMQALLGESGERTSS